MLKHVPVSVTITMWNHSQSSSCFSTDLELMVLFFFLVGFDDISHCIDLIICLGGDGTLLYASSLFQVLKGFTCARPHFNTFYVNVSWGRQVRG